MIGAMAYLVRLPDSLRWGIEKTGNANISASNNSIREACGEGRSMDNADQTNHSGKD